jgi:hypothetical protein
MKLQGKIFYLSFDENMCRDIEKAYNAGAKVSVGYDGEIKLWYIKPSKR